MMKISRIHPALPQPDRSLRRKMSANTAMNIQINMNQKKKTTNAHSTLPNVHSYASTEPLLVPCRRRAGAYPTGRPVALTRHIGAAYTAATEEGSVDVPDPCIARDRPGGRVDRSDDRGAGTWPDRLDAGAGRRLHRLVRGRAAREPDRGRRVRVPAERPDRVDLRRRHRDGRVGPDPRPPDR